MGPILGIGLLVLFVIAVPIAFAMGGASVIALLFGGNVPLVIVAQGNTGINYAGYNIRGDIWRHIHPY